MAKAKFSTRSFTSRGRTDIFLTKNASQIETHFCPEIYLNLRYIFKAWSGFLARGTLDGVGSTRGLDGVLDNGQIQAGAVIAGYIGIRLDCKKAVVYLAKRWYTKGRIPHFLTWRICG